VPWSQWFAVALGGALGAVLRQAVTLNVVRLGAAPFVGTLTVNAAGCFAIGWLVAWSERTGALSDPARCLWLVGALGAFTTYSTFASDVLELVRGDQPWLAALDVLAHLGVGALAIAAGRALGA
jgi:fluoride exporter